MLCQRCNQREATIHITQITNGMQRELHLCSDCAGRQFMPDMLTGKQLLEQIMQSQSAPDLQCPVCGTTLQDFQRTGYVGCPQCYQVFYKQMEPMLLAVHGATQHMVHHSGEEQPKAQQQEKQPDAMAQLRDELNRAVQEERFEQAAVLRDRLRVLEQEAKK